MTKLHLPVLVTLAVVLAGCGTGSSAGTAASAQAKAPTAVRLGKATVGEISTKLTYNADLQPKYLVNVLPKVSGRIVKLNVDLGSAVKKGDVIAEVEHTEVDAQMEQAKANLSAAQARLATVQAQGRPESVAQAQAGVDSAAQKLQGLQNQGRPEQVAQAKAGLDAANAKLSQLLAGPTPGQLQQARLAVEQAKDQLYAAQTVADAQVHSGIISKDQRQAQLDAAQTAIDQANAALKTLTDPPTADAVNQAKAAVDQATQQLALAQQPYTAQDLGQAAAGVRAAQAQRDLAARPYTAEDLQTAQAGVAQAQAAVDLVQTQLDNTHVTAPVDGSIAKKLANEGDMVSPTAPIVSVTSTAWEIAVQVAEDAISQIHEGEPVQMIAAAFPDKPFSGKVTNIAPIIDSQTRTFTVKVEPSGTLPAVRGGMSTRIDIPSVVHSNVLVVPKGAVVQKDNQNIAFTVDAGRAHLVQVKLGLTNDTSSEIVSGLSEGQSVVIQGQDNLTEGDPVNVAGA